MHFSYSLTFTYTFFRKLPALMSPRLDSRGRRTLWHPLCTPLGGIGNRHRLGGALDLLEVIMNRPHRSVQAG